MNARIPDAYNEFEDGQGSGQSFNFTPQLIAPAWSPGPTTVGSTLGVPPGGYVAGMQPDTSSTAGASAYATAVMSRGAGSHPIFWSVTLFMSGIVLLGMVAHLETKRRA